MMPPHERLYRCLLFILPPAMRREAKDELLETFNQEYQRAVLFRLGGPRPAESRPGV